MYIICICGHQQPGFSRFITVFGRTKIAQDRLALSDLLIASKMGRPSDRPAWIFIVFFFCMKNKPMSGDVHE